MFRFFTRLCHSIRVLCPTTLFLRPRFPQVILECQRCFFQKMTFQEATNYESVKESKRSPNTPTIERTHATTTTMMSPFYTTGNNDDGDTSSIPQPSPKTPLIKNNSRNNDASATDSATNSTTNTGTTASTTNTTATPSVQVSTSSLLHQYQQDDVLTTDLLAAIRCWNLARPNNISPTSQQSTTTHSIDSSTLTTTASISVASTSLASTSKTPSAKTPCRGNYSSRPSGLTARILEQDMMMQEERHVNMAVVPGPIPMENTNTNTWELGDNQETEELSREMSEKGTNGSKVKTQSVVVVAAPTTPQDDSPPLSIQESKDADALNVLQQTAKSLGLSPHDTALVLPTVEKLVKILSTHVPRLEQFCTKVCDLVEETNTTSSSPVERIQSQRKKNRKKKSMQARKERMDATLKTLQHTFSQERSSTSQEMITPRKQVRALQSMDPNTTGTTSTTSTGTSTTTATDQPFKCQDVVSAMELKTTLEQTLKRRKRPWRTITQAGTEPLETTPQKKNHDASNFTNQDVLKIVNELLSLEEELMMMEEEEKKVEFEEFYKVQELQSAKRALTTAVTMGGETHELGRGGETIQHCI